MFKLTRKWAYFPNFIVKDKYFERCGKYLSNSQKEFVNNNWYSIDAIEISFKNCKKEVILYEIKIKNEYKYDLGFKPKMTLATHNMYNSAKKLGFVVKLVYVICKDNWDYDIQLLEFCESNYCIDKPKKYDRKYSTMRAGLNENK